MAASVPAVAKEIPYYAFSVRFTTVSDETTCTECILVEHLPQ
jgi:hypothetical protein